MQEYVRALQQTVPPHSAPIDLADPHWLQSALNSLLEHIPRISVNEAFVMPYSADQYRRIIECTSLVVINYPSVSRPGHIGQRHTATLINPTLFQLPDDILNNGENQTDFSEENSVVFYWPKRKNAGLEGKIRKFWTARWRAYHGKIPASVTFTLNSALLFQATTPRPVFISWFPDEGFGEYSPDRILTPLALNVSPEVLESCLSDGGEYVGDGGLKFSNAFAAMFEKSPPGASEISASLAWLYKHFGDLGSRCFFSIPTSTRIRSGGNGASRNEDVRAVISVEMNAEWNPQLYQAAWNFYSGIAQQILTNILASEYVSYVHSQWEKSRQNAIYLASHPLKHRVGRIASIADEVRNGVFREVRAAGDTASDNLKVVEKNSAFLRQRARLGVQFLNLMNLLADLLDADRANESIKTSIEKNASLPRDGNGWVDISSQIRLAAVRASATGTSRRRVTLTGDLEEEILLPRRLTEFPLSRHQDKEETLFRLLFEELFQNAANYGEVSLAEDEEIVEVNIEVRALSNDYMIVLENLVDSEFHALARWHAERQTGPTDKFQSASGLTVAMDVTEQLGRGHMKIELANEEKKGGTTNDSNDMALRWRVAIFLEG